MSENTNGKNGGMLRRMVDAAARVLDEAKGLVEYVASDESLDSYRSVIRAAGWRFNRFAKNAPFVDSHNYEGIKNLLGRVVNYEVRGRQLIETVQWAIDVPENETARIGWAMTRAGYLRAVSVGFVPVRWVTRWTTDHKEEWLKQLSETNLTEESGVDVVYIEQEQLELSAAVIGANVNAVARSYKAGALNDQDLEFLTTRRTVKSAGRTDGLAHVRAAEERAREALRQKLLARIKTI